MKKVLKEFINEALNEKSGRDVPWNYWMRRPRNNQVRDLGNDIEDIRRDVFEPVADSFEEEVGDIRHSISLAHSISSVEDILYKKGLNVWDIVVDTTAFQNALDNEDIGEVKRQITQGIDKWGNEAVKNAEHDDFSIATLQGLGNLSDV